MTSSAALCQPAPSPLTISSAKQLSRFLEIVSLGDTVTITVYADDGSVTGSVSRPKEDLADATGDVQLYTDSIVVAGKTARFRDVRKITDSLYRSNSAPGVEIVSITWWKSSGSATAPRWSQSDMIAITDTIIETGAFVRGTVCALRGNVVVRGEVNRSVVSLDGDISLDSGAVVRGAAIAIGGVVTRHADAQLYGDLYSSSRIENAQRRRSHRGLASRQTLDFTCAFAYDRVDGFSPRAGWRFTDADSILPDVRILIGVSTALERTRLEFNVAQPLFNRYGVALVGSYYQKLASDDDYLLQTWQNTLLALIATTDYKNYYETEGGRIGVRFAPTPSLPIHMGVVLERWRAVDASPELWSLFGGDKTFPPNYQGLPASVDSSGADEIDRRDQRALFFNATLAPGSDDKNRRMHWRASASLESTIKSDHTDFSFNRYFFTAGVTRRISRYSDLHVRALLGASGGALPIYRRFFLGGYGWLRGFEHKEFSGTGAWSAAIDYGVSLKPVGLNSVTFWTFYDVGRICAGAPSAQSQFLQSVGLGLAVDGFVRFNLARRLDKSSPQIRFAVEF